MTTKLEDMVAEAFPCRRLFCKDDSHDLECPARHHPAALALAEAVVEMCEDAAQKKGFQFQDMQGWLEGESRNEMVGDVTEGICTAIRSIAKD